MMEARVLWLHLALDITRTRTERLQSKSKNPTSSVRTVAVCLKQFVNIYFKVIKQRKSPPYS